VTVPSSGIYHSVIAEYRRLTDGEGSIVDRLRMPSDAADVELEIPPRRELAWAADLD
jgi:hypothetical protein